MAKTITAVRPIVHSQDPMAPLPFRLDRVRMDSSDTFTMEMSSVDPERICRFKPGQFNMLYAHGVGEVPISISGDPSRPDTLVHTTREVGIVTRALRALRPGDMVGVRGPFGNSWPVESVEGSDIVLVAGGIGLAPLRPVIYHVMAERRRYGRFLLLYGTRTPEDILFKKELQRWRAQFDMEVYITVDRAAGGWRGNVGVVPNLIRRAPFSPSEAIAMICGPEVMMRYSVQELVSRGVAKSSVFLSMERNMKCGIGLCGHCQWRSELICRDGPVYSFDKVEPFFNVREL